MSDIAAAMGDRFDNPTLVVNYREGALSGLTGVTARVTLDGGYGEVTATVLETSGPTTIAIGNRVAMIVVGNRHLIIGRLP